MVNNLIGTHLPRLIKNRSKWIMVSKKMWIYTKTGINIKICYMLVMTTKDVPLWSNNSKGI